WSRPRRPRPCRRHRRPQRSSVMGRRILGRLGAALTCATGVLLAVATAASVSRATVNYQTPAVTVVPVVRQRGSPASELRGAARLRRLSGREDEPYAGDLDACRPGETLAADRGIRHAR